MKLRKILQIAGGVLFVAIILGYSLYQAEDFWAGPTITINTPADGIGTDQPRIQLTGQAERIAHLYVNGRQIYTNRNGRFSEKLLLTPGYNIITVRADDAFDRRVQKQVRVVLHATSSLLFSTYKHDRTKRSKEEIEGR